MVDLDKALKHVNKNIVSLEKELYNFENVALKRYEMDKKILADMRDHVTKMEAIKTKLDNGQDVTDEEFAEIPVAFR